MTVIVAARTKGNGVVMAADSLTTAGWEKIQPERTKLCDGPIVVGDTRSLTITES